MSNPTAPAWMQDELVKEIPQEKLALLQEFFSELNQKTNSLDKNISQKEMMMALLPTLKKAKASGLSFTPKEMQAAMAAIRKHSSPEGIRQIDKLNKLYSTSNKSPKN